MKKKIFYMVLGAIIFTTVGVGATTLIESISVSYNKHGVANVKEALDDLYNSVPKSRYDSDIAAAEAACPDGKECMSNAEYTELSTPASGCSGAVNRKKVGDTVTLPATKYGVTTNEEFYVIDSNECVTKLITKYNLYVGYSCTSSSNSSCSSISSSTSGYGVQKSTARGYTGSYTPGTLAFSGSAYWYWNGLEAKYAVNGASFSGNPYPYVYNLSSNLYTYVEAYKGYLGSIVKTARLATYEEMKNLGCTSSSSSCPSWIRYTSFWTGSADGSSNVWSVNAYYGFLDSSAYSNRYYRGVRPVIVISTSDIPS